MIESHFKMTETVIGKSNHHHPLTSKRPTYSVLELMACTGPRIQTFILPSLVGQV